MNIIEKINAYRRLLDDINTAIGRVDEQMNILIGAYEKLNSLHEKVTADITLEMASLSQGVRS